MKEEAVKTPQSPKVAVYDEWQELLKNAQKDGEAGAGRSRRTSRRLEPTESEPPASPRKKPRKQSISIVDAAKLVNTTPPLPKHTSPKMKQTSVPVIDASPDKDESTAIESKKVNQYEAMQELVKNAEQEAKESQDGIVKMKTRRSIRSFEGDEIPRVKSEMAVVHPRSMNDAIEQPATSIINDKVAQVKNDNAKEPSTEDVLLARRKSQPLKFSEADVLEENRLFMFAILALEGHGHQSRM
jgi:hypothetical protein